ncbi:DUF5067 domain-containing protein [Virgibacillus sp. FSP13]
MEGVVSFLMPLSILFLVISIISLLIKFLFQAGLSYKTHFISMGVSAGLVVYCIISALALGVAGNDDVSADSNINAQFVNKENKSDTQKQDAEEKRDQSPGKEFYFDGTNLVTQYFSIEITDYKVIQPGEDNNYSEEPVIEFSFETTVDKDVTDARITPDTAWFSAFKVVQDNDPNVVNDLDLVILIDEDDSDSGNQEIKPGGTVSSSMAYELTDEETPVTLTATENIFPNDVIGNYDYTIK